MLTCNDIDEILASYESPETREVEAARRRLQKAQKALDDAEQDLFNAEADLLEAANDEGWEVSR
jgi:hypothetical protein